MEPLLSGIVFWSYGHELQNRTRWESIISFVSSVPFHKHEGTISLTKTRIIIEGDETLSVPLSSIIKMFLGYDELFPRRLVRSFGLRWQPLRVTLHNGTIIYFIIDYTNWGNENPQWFQTLKEIL